MYLQTVHQSFVNPWEKMDLPVGGALIIFINNEEQLKS